MKRLAFLIGLLVLVWCVPATADWRKNCQADVDNGRQASRTTVLGGTGKMACHSFVATADDDPPVLQVTDCDNSDIFYYPDADGDGADSAGTVDVYTCPSSMMAATTEAIMLLACQPLNGGTQLDAANTEVFGVGAGFLWFDVEGWTDDNELQVVCNVGPE